MPTRFKTPQMVIDRKVRYGDPEETEHPDLRAFFAVWDAARGHRAMPIRADMSPKAMKAYLKLVHLYDVADAGRDFRCRLAGLDVFAATGIDMTGKLASEHPNAGVRERLTGALRHVVSTGKPAYVHVESVAPYPIERRVAETLLLPLGAHDQVDQIIALTIFAK